MNIIDALKSQDYATLKAYFVKRFKEKLDAVIQSKVEEYKNSLIAHNSALKAKVAEQ